MSEAVNEMTIFERIGGEAAISADADRLYERVLADPTLSNLFTGVSMSRLKAHQFAFLSQSLGGHSKQYNGQSMKVAYSSLAIEKRHFDAVGMHLVETMRELGVPEGTVGQIGAAVTPLSAQIVNTLAQAAIA